MDALTLTSKDLTLIFPFNLQRSEDTSLGSQRFAQAHNSSEVKNAKKRFNCSRQDELLDNPFQDLTFWS